MHEEEFHHLEDNNFFILRHMVKNTVSLKHTCSMGKKLIWWLGCLWLSKLLKILIIYKHNQVLVFLRYLNHFIYTLFYYNTLMRTYDSEANNS